MKKLLLLLVFAFNFSAYCQWIPQQSGVTTALNDVYCISENSVVVVGDFGVILKTTDGGEHWISKSSPTTEHIVKVQFVNAYVGFAVTSAGTVLKTTDAGETWSSTTAFNASYYTSLSCVNQNTLFIAKDELKKSTDGGQTFTTIIAPANIFLIQFLNEQTGYISCESGFYKTIDGGNSWTSMSNFHPDSFFFIDENIGFLASQSGYSKTTDGGQNFTELSFDMLGYHGQVSDVFATNQNTVWDTSLIMLLCWCPDYSCISKLDLNQNAEKPYSSNCEDFLNEYEKYNAIHFANETTGYVVGYVMPPMNTFPPVGTIYKNSTGTMPSMGVEENRKEAFKIYPNPAQDNIHVSFAENSKSAVQIEIVDSLGQIVYSQEYPTSNLVSIDTKNFAKGIYFLTVDQNQNKQTQKIVIY